jgi:hypothetical protein
MKLDIIGGNATGHNMKLDWFSEYNFKNIKAIVYLIAFFHV